MLTARRALLGLALLIAIAADSWAQSQPRFPSPEGANQPSQAQSGQASQPRNSDNRGTETAPFVIQILPSIQDQKGSAAESKNTSEDKIAEFTEKLYLATGALAFIAFLQLIVFGWQGWQLGRTVTHLTISERAHVSGGANTGTTGDGQRVLVVTINNYGKTPATIETVAATICRENELSGFPGWSVDRWEGHAFVKEWKGYVFGQIAGQPTDLVLPYEAGKCIAGRIWYQNIFKKYYSVGFLLHTDDLSAVGGHPSYWEEREKKWFPLKHGCDNNRAILRPAAICSDVASGLSARWCIAKAARRATSRGLRLPSAHAPLAGAMSCVSARGA